MGRLVGKHRDALLSLGFAFYGGAAKKTADPERTILSLLPSFRADRKLFRMLLAWLDIASDLVHIERLAGLAEEASDEDKIVLGAVASRLARDRDKRWALIFRNMKRDLEGKRLPSPPSEYADPYLVSKHGEDPHFREFGYRIAMLHPEDEKKILSLNGILRSNLWLRLRALIGPNFRADLVYLIVAGLAENPNQAASLLGCSRETAYRLWKAVTQFEDLTKLAS